MISTKTLPAAATTYIGTDGNDVLVGTGRANVFIGSQGFDTLVGGGSNDTASYENTPFIEVVEIGLDPLDVTIEPTQGTGVIVDLAAGTATKTLTTYTVTSNSVTSAVEIFTDRLIGIENAIGGLVGDTLLGSKGNNLLSGMDGNDLLDGRGGADSLVGGDGEDLLLGGTGDDVLSGGNDNDRLSGDAGADRIDGGDNGPELVVHPIFSPGIPPWNFAALRGDVVSYETSTEGVRVDLTLKGPQSGGDAQGDLLTNIESVSGSAMNDVLTVSGGYAWGNGGQDVLYGGHASDGLIGGLGGDTLFGGGGDDLLLGDEQDPAALGTAKPGAEADELYGGDGNDFLVGGAGGDLLNGGAGDDIYSMVDADDVIKDVSGIDTVITAEGTYILGDDLENLIFAEGGVSQSHVGAGNAKDNILIGNSGNDTLFAGDGDDILDGRGGNDLYARLQGNDTIVMSDGLDRAVGFNALDGNDHDVIDMSHYGFNNLQEFYDQGGTITQVGKGTQINLGGDGPTLFLQGVSSSDIDETDFYFG